MVIDIFIINSSSLSSFSKVGKMQVIHCITVCGIFNDVFPNEITNLFRLHYAVCVVTGFTGTVSTMFSLVTALVSPCVIELLAHKKEALVATLQENASVVCSHPADSVCLLQGEWDNVKKAYAIVEEFYLRAQAESVVRRMMKVEPGTDARPDFSSAPSNVIGGRIPPDQVLSLLLSPPPTDEGEQTAVGKPDDSRRSPKNSLGSLSPDMQSNIAHQQRMFAFSQSATMNGIAATAASTSDAGIGSLQQAAAETSCRSTRSHDDSPPVLSREGNVDEISEESDTSEFQGDVVIRPGGSTLGMQNCQPESTFVAHVNGPKETTMMDTSDIGRLAAAATSTTNLAHPEHVNMVSSSRRLEQPLPAAAAASTNRGQLFAGNELFGHMQQSCHHQSVPHHAQSDGAVARLPQIASLFSGVGGSSSSGALSAAAAAAAWPYAELYSAHLSAMRSICESTVKRESAVDPAGFGSDRGRPAPVSSGTGGSGYRPEDDPLAPEMRCSRCDKTYRSEARMREHARTHDAGYVAVLHACPKCGKAFTYRHNMVVHLRRFHYGWQPAKRHACRTCGMRFQKPYLLRLHERKAHLPGQMDSGVNLHR